MKTGSESTVTYKLIETEPSPIGDVWRATVDAMMRVQSERLESALERVVRPYAPGSEPIEVAAKAADADGVHVATHANGAIEVRRHERVIWRGQWTHDETEMRWSESWM